MALQIPNIYTLGQVQVSTQPLAQLQGKLLAEQQAKQEAVDKYFDKQIGSLDKEGIADNDVPDYEQGIKDLNAYWQQNKDDIRRGGTAKMNFDKLVQDQKKFIYDSKQKKNQLFELRKQYQFGGKTPTNSDMVILDRMGLRLKDENRINPATGKPWGIEDLSMQIPAFDLNKRSSWFGDISAGIKPGLSKKVSSKILPNGDIEESYEVSYSPEQIKFMQDKAVQALPTSRTALNDYEKILSDPNLPENKERLKKLNEAWVNSGLHPNQKMETAADLAMADVLLENYLKPPAVEKRIINMPKAGGGIGGGATGPKTKLEDYYILNKYTNTETLPDNTGRVGIKVSNINAVDKKLLDRFLDPAYIKGQEWYIVRNPGEWEGDEGKFITDEKLALDQAPVDVQKAYLLKGGGGKGKKTGAKDL